MAKKKKQLNFQVLDLDGFWRAMHTDEGLKFFNEYFKHYEKDSSARRLHETLERGDKILLASVEERGKQKPVGLITFSEGKKAIHTVRTFVAKKFRRQDVAKKMSYHLVGMARSKEKIIYRALQSEEMHKLAKKMRNNPRTLYHKGKAVGAAEVIGVSDGKMGDVVILPSPANPKAKKSALLRLGERLKKLVKRPR
jgi:hypothetical protein